MKKTYNFLSEENPQKFNNLNPYQNYFFFTFVIKESVS